jgi:hypothetical protein
MQVQGAILMICSQALSYKNITCSLTLSYGIMGLMMYNLVLCYEYKQNMHIGVQYLCEFEINVHIQGSPYS